MNPGLWIDLQEDRQNYTLWTQIHLGGSVHCMFKYMSNEFYDYTTPITHIYDCGYNLWDFIDIYFGTEQMYMQFAGLFLQKYEFEDIDIKIYNYSMFYGTTIDG